MRIIKIDTKLSLHKEGLNMQFFFDILKYFVWEKAINTQTIPDSNRIKFMLRNN